MRALLGALLVVGLLAGCATIPTSGTVNAGRTDISAAPNFIITPVGPAQNASPKDIVNGFVIAQQGSSFAVAREFLTADFAQKWNPRAGVMLHDQLLTPKATSDSTVTVTVPYTGSVDSTGVYSARMGTRPLLFTLKQVQGQWRISDAPDGILLPTTSFERTYQASTLQYFSPDFARLVPDVRWFPSRTIGAATTLAALLRGQAPQLGGGATATAMPSGTRLAATPTVVDGVTEVALDTPGSSPSSTVSARMYQQVAASLQVRSSAQLQLTVDGRVVSPAALVQNPQADSRPAALVDGKFGLLQSNGAVAETALGRRIAATRPRAITVSRQGWAAVRDSAGVQVVSGSGAVRTVDSRDGLAYPSIDQDQWVYSIPQNDPSGLIAVDRSGRKASLRGADLPGTSVSAIEVSRDGTRLLALVQTSNGQEAVVAGIERDSSGAPTGLTSTRYVQPITDASAKWATWLDDSQIAVLTFAPTGDDVVAYRVGGLSQDLGKLSDVDTIVGGNGSSDLRALLLSGDLSISVAGQQWAAEFPNTVDVQVLAIQR